MPGMTSGTSEKVDPAAIFMSGCRTAADVQVSVPSFLRMKVVTMLEPDITALRFAVASVSLQYCKLHQISQCMEK